MNCRSFSAQCCVIVRRRSSIGANHITIELCATQHLADLISDVDLGALKSEKISPVMSFRLVWDQMLFRGSSVLIENRAAVSSFCCSFFIF